MPSPTLAVATLVGMGASSFAITNDGCQGSALGPPPSQCTVTVQFAPQATGTSSATLSVNGPAGALTTAKVSATGAPIWVQEAVDLTLKPLGAVWVADVTHVYAVGSAGTIVYRGPTGTWSTRTLVKSPAPDLLSVSGSAWTDVYVAGGGIFHSTDSATWSEWEAGNYPGVIVFNSGDIWGTRNDGNNPSIYHWTSAGWTQVTAGISAGFLWGTGGTDLYSFGGESQCGLGACTWYAEITHTDSTGKWLRQFTQSSPGPLNISALWGFGVPASNLYAVADLAGLPLHSSGDGMWTETSGSPPKGCSAIWGANDRNLWFGCSGGLYAYDGSWEANAVDAREGMQYSRPSMRRSFGLALLALIGCNDKPAATTTVTPAPTITALPLTTADLAPSDATSGAAVMPKASGAATPPGVVSKPDAHFTSNASPGAAQAARPARPIGIMPHGSPEDGTLKYSVPSPPTRPVPAPTQK